jgi:translation initiation factor 1 (eIF-1/SUI1)
MGKVKIKVDVFGGVAPLPIQVKITEKNNGNVVQFKKEESFEEVVDLPSGQYIAIIAGQNHKGGKTVIIVSGKKPNGDSFNLKKTKTDKYSASFTFTI